MVSGDRRPHLVGLIVPDPEWEREWAQVNDVAYDEATLKANTGFQAAVRAAVDAVNRDLPVTDKVRAFVFADEPVTIEHEVITPSTTMRRPVITARHVERMYALSGDIGRDSR